MPVLELVMDSTGLERGRQQAEAALKGVQTQATATQSSLTTVGGGLRNTFQAVQGVSQVGQGINSTATAFASLNLSMGAFAASRTLLEIGKTAQDFQQMAGVTKVVTTDIYGMTTATTKAASGWSLLGAAVRTHPLLAIATVLGTVASLMALFGSNTKEAATEFDKLSESMSKIRIDEKTQRFLGLPSAPSTGSEAKLVYDALTLLLKTGPGTTTQPTTYSLAQAQDIFGKQSRGGFATELQQYVPNLGQGVRESGGSLGDVQIPYSALTDYARDSYLRFQRQAQATGVRQDPFSVVPPGSYTFGTPDPYGLRPPGATGRGDYVSISPTQQGEVDAERRAAYNQQVIDAMEKAAAYAGQIGSSLGAAVFDVAAGIQNWRQALLSIVSSFARQGLSSLGSSLFESTTRQLQGNTAPTSVNPNATVLS